MRDRLDRERQLPVDKALRVVREIADALSFAHSHDVIHRDVKPGNILLEAGHAFLADFGLAKALRGVSDEEPTQTGFAVGTPTYSSPEQVVGDEVVDRRSDLYALGCVLYEMLAGQPPFTGPTVDSVVRQHLTRDPPSVRLIRPAVPEPVVEILNKMLRKAPADRYSTAFDLLRDFDSAASGEWPSGPRLKQTWRRRFRRIPRSPVPTAP